MAPVKRTTIVVPCFLGNRGSHFGGQPFQFTFCPNFFAGSIRNVVYDLFANKPDIPKVWPIAPGTHINQERADALWAARFVVVHGVSDNKRVEAQIPSDRPPVYNVN
jgi:hypothetical protein